MLIVFLVIMCAVFGVVVYFVFTSGLLSGGDRDGGGGGGVARSDTGSYGYGFGYDLKPPRLGELSPGCLITIIVAASIWFIAWGIVLLVAIKLLRTPLD